MSRNYAKNVKTKALIFFDEKPPEVSVPNDWALFTIPPGGMGNFTRLVGEDPDMRLCRLAYPYIPDSTMFRARVAQYLETGLPKLAPDERTRLETVIYHNN